MSDLYKALDFLNCDELYTEEERMIRDTVRSWVSDRFMPVIEEHTTAAESALQDLAGHPLTSTDAFRLRDVFPPMTLGSAAFPSISC